MTTVFKVEVGTSDGKLHTCDGVEWRGKLWLVPYWIDRPATGETTPLRVIRFDNLPYADVRGSKLGDFVIHDPIPKELFDVQSPREPIGGYEYIDTPAMNPPADKSKLQ